MKYMGGKSRHGKQIFDAIVNDLKSRGANFDGAYWIEPFVGGCNVLDKVDTKLFPVRFASDINGYVINMFTRLTNDNWFPPKELSEDQYYELRMLYKDGHNADTGSRSADIAFAGIACSYGGKWWGGYARGKTNKGESRNYAREAHDHLMKQKEKLRGVYFYTHSYRHLSPIELNNLKVIYCDPPYRDTTVYDFNKSFDHDNFWSWCERMVSCGYEVYVSEYESPERWECIWQKDNVNSSLTKNTGGKKAVEKLFRKVN